MGVKAMQRANALKRKREGIVIERLSQMPIPSGCCMTIYRCKDCKQVGAWVYLEANDLVGYFYDPCRCMLDASMNKGGKGATPIAHLP